MKKLESVLKVEELDGFLNLTVCDAKANLQEILKTAGKVESVEMRSPTLNDVFLHYTGREIREGPAEGGYGTRIMMSEKRR